MARLREEFRCKKFGFHCDYEDAKLFYRTEYSENRLVYLIYRAAMFIYQFGWLMAYYIYGGINNPSGIQSSYFYLTLWGNAINAIYFMLSLILAIIGYVNRGNFIINNSKCLIVLRSIAWILHSVGQTSAIIITIVYWVTLAPTAAPGTLGVPFNIHQHAINSVVYVIEIFVVAFPMHVLHFVYPMIFGVVYTVATLIYYATGITPAVYPILSWQDSPGVAVGYSVGCIVGCSVVHFVMYLLHVVRRRLYKKCCSTRPQLSSNLNLPYTNSGFALEKNNEKSLPYGAA